MKKVFKIIGIIIAIIAVAAVVYFIVTRTKSIDAVATDQLSALRSGDITTAYSFTSKDFKTATSLDEFATFVDGNPELSKNKSGSFSNKTTQGDTGTLKATLVSTDGSSTTAEYIFVKESGSWKILSIDLADSAGATVADTSTGKISKILANTTTDSDQTVQTGITTFKADTASIEASVYISEAMEGSIVSAQLTYTKTGDTVGPAENTVDIDGDIISNFSFSKPTNGWPVGAYALKATLSNGQTSTLNLTVQ